MTVQIVRGPHADCRGPVVDANAPAGWIAVRLGDDMIAQRHRYFRVEDVVALSREQPSPTAPSTREQP